MAVRRYGLYAITVEIFKGVQREHETLHAAARGAEQAAAAVRAMLKGRTVQKYDIKGIKFVSPIDVIRIPAHETNQFIQQSRAYL